MKGNQHDGMHRLDELLNMSLVVSIGKIEVIFILPYLFPFLILSPPWWRSILKTFFDQSLDLSTNTVLSCCNHITSYQVFPMTEVNFILDMSEKLKYLSSMRLFSLNLVVWMVILKCLSKWISRGNETQQLTTAKIVLGYMQQSISAIK